MPLPRQKIRNAPTPPPARELLSPKLRDLCFRPGPNGTAEWVPSRYKVPYGGRGGAKTWGMSGLGVTLGAIRQLRFLCTREYQSSIKESVHQILSSRVIDLGLAPYYDILHDSIRGKIRDADGRRTEFIFAGIKSDPAKVKGTEDIDVCLIEESEKVSKASWKDLVPTVRNRRGGSEIWPVFNPRDATDPTFTMFAAREPCPAHIRRVKVNWRDNPWFPADLDLDRLDLLRQIEGASDDDERVQLQQDYDHIWEGECQKRTDASVFRRRVVVHDFPDPSPDDKVRILLGADWGFANDPTCLIRMWTTSDGPAEELWVSHEAYGYRVENDEIPQLFDSVPGSRVWTIKADCARPETISHVASKGFRIEAAEKW